MFRYLFKMFLAPAVLLAFMIFFTQYAEAYYPQSFNYQGKKAIFIDIQRAEYHIIFDLKSQATVVESTLYFEQNEAGNALFDLVPTPVNILLDDRPITATEIYLPENISRMRLLSETTAAGPHTLKMKHTLGDLVRFDNGGVSAAFWTSDLEDRKFLESYLPANLEFDQMSAIFTVEFRNSSVNQQIYSNGVESKLAANKWRIQFPKYFTSSSFYFHTTPENTFKEERAIFKSVDGRDIPVLVYNYNGGSSLTSIKNRTLEILTELERDYGAFPHQKVVVYNAGYGGMEYCGATMTDVGALGHELTHSYFARGIMPANGNAGWIDEALASWRDNRYPQVESLGSMSTRMGAHPLYNRKTDRAAYSSGAKFMAYLNYRFKEKGGLKVFLRDLVEKKIFSPMVTDEFKKDLETFYGDDLSILFTRHIYGGSKNLDKDTATENPMHQKMTTAELRNFL